MRYIIYTVEYYSVIKNEKILPFETSWMDHKGIMLSEICQRKRLCNLTYKWNQKKKRTSSKNLDFEEFPLWLSSNEPN